MGIRYIKLLMSKDTLNKAPLTVFQIRILGITVHITQCFHIWHIRFGAMALIFAFNHLNKPENEYRSEKNYLYKLEIVCLTLFINRSIFIFLYSPLLLVV